MQATLKFCQWHIFRIQSHQLQTHPHCTRRTYLLQRWQSFRPGTMCSRQRQRKKFCPRHKQSSRYPRSWPPTGTGLPHSCCMRNCCPSPSNFHSAFGPRSTACCCKPCTGNRWIYQSKTRSGTHLRGSWYCRSFCCDAGLRAKKWAEKKEQVSGTIFKYKSGKGRQGGKTRRAGGVRVREYQRWAPSRLLHSS